MTVGQPETSAGSTGRESVWQFLHRPLMGPLIRKRKVAVALVFGCAVQATLVGIGLPGMACPVPRLFHVPCPGCGLTRASVALLSGHFAVAMTIHAFSILAVLAGGLLAVSIPLNASGRERLADAVEGVERRWGVSGVLIVALFFYWAVRLLYSAVRAPATLP